jgi:hypothetical protein
MNCDCDILHGGYCERHGVEKSPHLVRLCRTNERYYLAWEEGRGPGQNKRPLGLGDMVASGLGAIGITKERVSKVLRRPCGCCGRQETLNRLGRKIGIGK